MGAGDLLRVKPRIILGGGLKGQNVVLDIVPAHKDGVAVVGDILKRGEGLYFFCLVVFRPLQIALTVKLVADLRKFRVAVGAVDRVDNAFKVGKLLPALLDKLAEQLFRILRLAVFLKIFLGVRRWGEGGVGLDPDRLILTVEVLNVIERRALFKAILVCEYQLRIDAKPIFVGAGVKLRLPALQLPCRPCGCVAEQLEQRLAALTGALKAIFFIIKIVEQFRKRAETFRRDRKAVLRDIHKCKVIRLYAVAQQHCRLRTLAEQHFFYLSELCFEPLQGYRGQLVNGGVSSTGKCRDFP